MALSFWDIVVFVLYGVSILTVALVVSRKKSGESTSTNDYFLAGNTLPWWAIGTSLIAANISAEQLIGMTGDGFEMGLAIATYEWMAAATLLIVGKYFMPLFLEKRIYSMPQFLELRYDGRVRTIMSILWLMLYVFVNLTSILYLGGICLEQVFGVELHMAIIYIALFSAMYTMAGGLKAIAYTDFIQVGFLVLGGMLTLYLAFDFYASGHSFTDAAQTLVQSQPQKFKMIFDSSDAFYSSLPGVLGVFGCMWIINLNYWGFNQYISQRALAAKNINEAQHGILLAGYLKLLMPLIVVLPGIVAYAIIHDPISPNSFSGLEINKDGVYPWLLNVFLTPGIKGVVLAALVAAIVGSLSSKTNSIATIFAMDVYKPFWGKTASDRKIVNVGRVSIAISLAIAVALAPYISLFKGGFQFIQVFSGLFSPGIFVIFLFGLFWKKANTQGALWVAVATLPLSLFFYFFMGETSYAFVSLPFLYRIGCSFVLLSGLMVYISNKQKNTAASPMAIQTFRFPTSPIFNWGALGIILILIVLYSVFW